MDIDRALKDSFGFDSFQPGQREVIEFLLAGRSAAAVFPTGGGKSLCYQLPATLLPGLTLVVSPLIALMKDQIDALAARGIAASRLDSSLGPEEYRNVMERVRSSDLRLLYVAPERFNNERFRQAIKGVRVSLFAVDEAHCISEWGHNFRPDYLKLARYAEEYQAERTFALTATATEKVLVDICRAFSIRSECAVRTGFYRANLTVVTTSVTHTERDELLLKAMLERPRGPTVVYVTLQKTSEQVAERLAGAGLPARAYHAGQPNDQRSDSQEWFLRSPDGVMVATIAFGMGIDKPDIRYVYHYNPPKSLENYSQEIGRAGRDGQTSLCEMFLCPSDLNVLENFIYGDTPAREAVQGVLEEVFSQGDRFDVSIEDLALRHDVRPLVVRTLLTYLELGGFLEGGTPIYSAYRFKPLASSQEILSHFTGEQRILLADLFRQATRKRLWFDLDVSQAAQTMGADRGRLIRALDYLADENWLELKAAGVRHRYRRLKTPDLASEAESLYARVLEREASELRRLEQVVELVYHPGCQVAALCAHFGESHSIEPCGHCSWCLEKAPQRRERPVPPLDPGLWEKALALRQEHPDVLGHPRGLARFLCGVTSPRLSRAKLGRHGLFGALCEVPFPQVLDRAELVDPGRGVRADY